jgi:HSP20 family protein
MNTLTTRTGIGALRKEMDRLLLDRFWDVDFRELPATFGDWAPKLDVAETKDALVVRAEIPGIDPKEIYLSLHDHVLTIRGEKTHEEDGKEEHYYRMERARTGAFARTMRLPVSVDGSKVIATFKNGLLTVTLPKAPAAKGTTIPIKAE